MHALRVFSTIFWTTSVLVQMLVSISKYVLETFLMIRLHLSLWSALVIFFCHFSFLPFFNHFLHFFFDYLLIIFWSLFHYFLIIYWQISTLFKKIILGSLKIILNHFLPLFNHFFTIFEDPIFWQFLNKLKN